MKPRATNSLVFHIAGLAALLLAAAPVHAADDVKMDLSGQTGKVGHPHYLRAGKPDAASVLAPPPLPDSPEQSADLEEVRAVYHAASSNDKSAAYSEKQFDIFNFTPAIGSFFQAGKFPRTEDFFRHVQSDAVAATDAAKKYWKRPRPYTLDPTLANGKLEKSFSYPSGHSTESSVLALVLSELFPEKREAIMAVSRNIGWRRVEIARHYPTDIYAGRVFAQAIVHEMKKNKKFKRDLAEAQNEVESSHAKTMDVPAYPAAVAAH